MAVMSVAITLHYDPSKREGRCLCVEGVVEGGSKYEQSPCFLLIMVSTVH